MKTSYSWALKEITTANTDLNKVRETALAENMVTLRENAIRKLVAGITTVEEVLRVTWEQVPKNAYSGNEACGL